MNENLNIENDILNISEQKVPPLEYLLIGSGKLALHLKHYFQLLKNENSALKIKITSWDRNQDPHKLNILLETCTHVLLAISDKSIEDFYKKHLQGWDIPVIHFSGALSLDGLYCAHPLMTFSTNLYTLDIYKKIHFTVSESQTLQELFPFLENKSTRITSEQKAFYHALCVTSGNFPIILWNQCLDELKKLGYPDNILDLYLNQTLNNFIRLRKNALTGPLSRKDNNTIEKNLLALEGNQLQSIYKSFKEATL